MHVNQPATAVDSPATTSPAGPPNNTTDSSKQCCLLTIHENGVVARCSSFQLQRTDDPNRTLAFARHLFGVFSLADTALLGLPPEQASDPLEHLPVCWAHYMLGRGRNHPQVGQTSPKTDDDNAKSDVPPGQAESRRCGICMRVW